MVGGSDKIGHRQLFRSGIVGIDEVAIVLGEQSKRSLNLPDCGTQTSSRALTAAPVPITHFDVGGWAGFRDARALTIRVNASAHIVSKMSIDHHAVSNCGDTTIRAESGWLKPICNRQSRFPKEGP
ncbi:hypothetical protein MRB53_019622 [Persea americana]|uniref:Uncharacterized protein n=1 Tax=Persea americana TaxID=3435 RepID=A0ACC2KZ80_PERAE|nr:hypothetical protein MRB53_019622 [Persea americana]